MSSSTIRKALGAVKDQTSISLANVTRNIAPELDVLIVKTTSHDDEPAEERHIREILHLTGGSRAHVAAAVAGCSKRFSRTQDYVVALKSLMLVHRLLTDGDPFFHRELLQATCRGTRLLNLSDFWVVGTVYLQTIPRRLMLALKSLRGLDLFSTGACYEVLQELASSTIYLKMLGFTVGTVGEITKLAQLETVSTQALCMHHVQGKSDPDIINLKFLSKLKDLRELAIVQSFDSQKVLEAEGGPESDYYQQLLPHLEIFELNNLFSLEKVIWKNAGLNIRVVSICDCDKLKDVTWVHHLKYLEQLTVSQCQGMERLIAVGESSQDVAMNQTATISFPRLQKLTLEELPMLSMISQQACRFEDLSCISVTRCNEMKGIHDQEYKQLIKIHCSKDWWTESKSAGTSNPYLMPTFFSRRIK